MDLDRLHIQRAFLSLTNTLLILMVVVTGFSCVHDTSIIIVNSPPKIKLNQGNADTLCDTLYFPDSTIGPLTVEDLNDTAVMVDPYSWPGTCSQKNFGYGPKVLDLYLGGNTMGSFTGDLIVCDKSNSSDTLPFSIRKLFAQNFNGLSMQQNWQCYNTFDSARFEPWVISIIDKQQPIGVFVTGIDDSTVFSGFRSKFRLIGDFTFTLEYALQDMTSGSELGVFVSSNSEPGIYFYDGECGVKMRGIRNILSMNYGSSFSELIDGAVPNKKSGFLQFVKNDQQLTISHRAQTMTKYSVLASSNVDEGAGLYIHFSITGGTVSLGTPVCQVGNFNLSQGTIVF